MTTTLITDISHLLYLGDYVGDFAEDYDMPAVQADYLVAINSKLILSDITVYANGQVYAEVGLAADYARTINWEQLLALVDPTPILERHDRTAKG